MANLKYKHTAYTSAQWASLNPVIVENEIVIESDTKRTKIGNGISTYNQLEYADANSIGNSLGSIKPTDAAPTPARNGNYTFSIGGSKPAWLTAEAGITEVKAGDGVAVVYTAPSSYTYTHVAISRIIDIYNVTLDVPLGSGYYTLITAVAAVAVGLRKKGLVITFESAAGVWETYQFTGASTATWTTLAQWVKETNQLNVTELVELPIAEVLNVLYAKTQAIEAFIKTSQYGNVTADQVDIVRNFNVWGKTNLIIEGVAAPTVVPDFVGQTFVNTAAGVTYTAKGIASVADWKQTSN